ncbi:Pfam:DUF3317 [Teratosphaeria destructans]|uniref:Pfam:DUF3317 n=1 Tax=Teratosphaeria destructans TaxID=418781 RepID=A0A9W7W756_9PEZI|nr:Pfam:DUF3317 [Teratosphaeria destructans]
MATYNPPSFPRRPKTSNLFTETRYQLQLAYYRYEVNSALYVMSPGEKIAYNTIVFSLLLMLVLSVYYYFPRTVQLGFHRLGYYIMGSQDKLQLAASVAVDRTLGASEAVASLKDPGLGAVAGNASLYFEL